MILPFDTAFYILILHLFYLPLSPIYSIHAIHHTKLYCQVTNRNIGDQ